MLYEQTLEEFINYVNLQETKTIDDKILDLIKMKYIHSLEVVKDGNYVSKLLNFNDSFVDLIKICCLDHDVGRFKQALLLGNLSDFELKQLIGLDHGGLGANILKNGLLEKQLSIRTFDSVIEMVVRNHVGKEIDYKDLLILERDILISEDAIYFFSNAPLNERLKVINTITQIVQDVDRLDIYHQILDKRYVPKKSDEIVDSKILDMFYQRKYLNISEIKRIGLWNPNVGELVRLSFINQIKLLSVAKMIYEENIINRMNEIRDNPIVKDAFLFTQQSLKEMIDNSIDGITVKKLELN